MMRHPLHERARALPPRLRLRAPGPLAALTVLGCALTLALALPSPARADGTPDERARALVDALRAKESEAARQDLFGIGARALPALGHALAGERDPVAWTRLEEMLASVIGQRLEALETLLSRDLAARRERAKVGMDALDAAVVSGTAAPAPPPPLPAPEVVVREAEAIEGEILSAGFAAARELGREGALRDEVTIARKGRMLETLLARFDTEARDPAGREALVEELAGLGPLAAPLLARRVAEGPAESREAAKAAAASACERFAGLMLGEGPLVGRAFGEEGLFGMGEAARPFLERLAKEGSPDAKARAARLLQRIRWSYSEALYRRTGHILEGFEARPWRERRIIAYELEKQGGPESVPTLRRILERDPSVSVRVAAAEALAREGDPAGRRFLFGLGLAPLTQSPEVIASIAMDQGIKYLTIRRYDKAIEEFQRVLEIQPTSEIALYNLACAYALKHARDGTDALRDTAFEYLTKAIEKGFDDVEHMQKDSDLRSLREDPRWAEITGRLQRAKAAKEGGER